MLSRARKPRHLPLDQRFAYCLSKIDGALMEHLQRYVGREFGLKLAEYRVLSVLWERDFPSIRDIAARNQLDKAHVTRALADLTARGLATQVVDQQDRRLRAVTLTPAGRKLIEATLPFTNERQERMERCLSALEIRVLWKALSLLSDQADRMLAEEQEKGRRQHPRAAGTKRRA